MIREDGCPTWNVEQHPVMLSGFTYGQKCAEKFRGHLNAHFLLNNCKSGSNTSTICIVSGQLRDEKNILEKSINLIHISLLPAVKLVSVRRFLQKRIGINEHQTCTCADKASTPQSYLEMLFGKSVTGSRMKQLMLWSLWLG